MLSQQKPMSTRMLDPKAEIARRQSELNLTRMMDKYVEAEATQASNTEMLRAFAEITFTLHEVNMVMLELKDMFHVLDDSLDIMDDCFNCFEDLMANHLYTAQDARKTKKMVKQFTKGITKKVKNMMRMVKSVSSISGVLTKTLSSLRSPGTYSTKKKGKKGEAPAPSSFDTFIADYRAKKGLGSAGGDSAPAGAGAVAGGGAPAPSGGDLTDVSDITGDNA